MRNINDNHQENYIRYLIKPTDAFNAVASRVGIPDDVLMEFHNKRCGQLHKIWFNNLKGLEYILIPTRYISEEEKEELEKVHKNKTLPPAQYFPKFHKENYTVEEVIHEALEKEIRITYDVRLDVKTDGNQNLLDFSLEGFTKDGNTPDDKISELSLECMASVSPIQFLMNNNGTLHSCVEYEGLVRKFESKRPEIENFHIGETTEDYVQTFYNTLCNEDAFFRKMKSTLLNQVLFFNHEWFWRKQEWGVRLTIYKNTFPLVFGFHKEHFFEDEKQVKTLLKGQLSEHCNLRELLKSVRDEDDAVPQDPIEAEIEIRYFTDKETKQLVEAKAMLDIRNQGELYLTHQIHITQKL